NRVVHGVENAIRPVNVAAVISRGHHVNDASGNAVADRQTQRRTVPDADQTQVRHLDLRGILRDVIDALDDRGGDAGTGVVHHFDRPQSRSRRHADDTDAVVQGRGNAGDVGAVPVPIGGLSGNKADVGKHVQV